MVYTIQKNIKKRNFKFIFSIIRTMKKGCNLTFYEITVFFKISYAFAGFFSLRSCQVTHNGQAIKMVE